MKKNRLKKLLGKLEEDPFEEFDKEVSGLKSKLEEQIKAETLDEVNAKIKETQDSLDLTPLIESVEVLKEELTTKEEEVRAEMEEVTAELKAKVTELNGRLSSGFESTTGALESDISVLQERLRTLEVPKKDELPAIRTEISNLETKIKRFVTELGGETNKTNSDLKKGIGKIEKDFKEEVEKVRTELLVRISSLGGGSANQKISVNGVWATSRYADLNIVLTGATATSNNTTKTTDIDLDGAFTGGFLRLDQSTSQTVVNGTPTFVQGIGIGPSSSNRAKLTRVDEGDKDFLISPLGDGDGFTFRDQSAGGFSPRLFRWGLIDGGADAGSILVYYPDEILLGSDVAWADGSAVLSVDQNNRKLHTADSLVSLDWANKQLYGPKPGGGVHQVAKWSGGDFAFDITPDITGQPNYMWGITALDGNGKIEMFMGDNTPALGFNFLIDSSAGTGDRLHITANSGGTDQVKLSFDPFQKFIQVLNDTGSFVQLETNWNTTGGAGIKFSNVNEAGDDTYIRQIVDQAGLAINNPVIQGGNTNGNTFTGFYVAEDEVGTTDDLTAQPYGRFYYNVAVTRPILSSTNDLGLDIALDKALLIRFDGSLRYSMTDGVFKPGTDGGGDLGVAGAGIRWGNAYFSGEVEVADQAYGSGWNGDLSVPTKNAIYDKIETIASDVLFDQFADATVGGAEADIYTNTLAAGQLSANGQKILVSYGGNFVTGGTELTQLKVYFGGTAIWDSTGVAPTTGTTSWGVSVEIIRVSSTTIRYNVRLNTTGASGYVYNKVDQLAGLTLSNTNILKITGTSSGVGSGSGDIIGKMGYVEFKPAA